MEGHQPYLGDLLTMVTNHLLTGMILQVDGWALLFQKLCIRQGIIRGITTRDPEESYLSWGFGGVDSLKNYWPWGVPLVALFYPKHI